MKPRLHRGILLSFLVAGANCAAPLPTSSPSPTPNTGAAGSAAGSFPGSVTGFGGTGNGSGSVGQGFPAGAFSSPTPPPPMSGGTLLVTKDGSTAVAADSARDVIWLVDLQQKGLRGSLALEPHDEPGRLVEDGAGLVHVALRGGHAIVTLNPSTGAIAMRREACEEPRGIAYDPATDLIHVACATGALLSFSAAGGDAVRRLSLDRDLRDVVVDGDRLLVSRFRAADLLVISSTGVILNRWQMAPYMNNNVHFEADVAWRTIAAPGGGALMVHQSASVEQIQTNIGGYSGGGAGNCSAIVQPRLTSFSPEGEATPVLEQIVGAVPIDVALTRDKRTVAVALPGNATDESSLGGIVAAPQIVLQALSFGDSRAGSPGRSTGCGTSSPVSQAVPTNQTVTAIDFDPAGNLVYQTWDPPTVGVITTGETVVVQLPGETRQDTGHLVFHRATPAGLACASCHPEGGEDGRTWNFADVGPRRTQSLRVGVIGTEPFHWGGELADLSVLVHNVFETRMSGPALPPAQVAALAHWLNEMRPWQPPAPADPAAVERGTALFQSQGCASCHNGPKLTNNATANVGTLGGAFQVPSLIGVGFRAPFLHDGCAPTLLDRFGPCGGGDRHGASSLLGQNQLQDLVAYLQSL